MKRQTIKYTSVTLVSTAVLGSEGQPIDQLEPRLVSCQRLVIPVPWALH